MNIVLRGNGGDRALLPFYRPWLISDEMNRLAREMWDVWSPFSTGDKLVPQTDLYEENDQLVMKTELPGIEKKDLDISLEGDRLTVKAERKEDIKEGTTHHTRECRYGQYYRSIRLPYPVKENKISATLDNGVLEIRLPKAEEVKSRRIEVKAELPEEKPGKPEKPKRVRKQKASE
jgi:HSP20 family protein